jgi:UDP-glucose 4-epimerase
MTIAWVIGNGGMLGAALSHALRRHGTTLFVPQERFCWAHWQILSAQMAANVQAFAKLASTADHWEVYWAAGIGTMNSTTEALASESQALAYLLQLFETEPCLGHHGSIAFASSAGAIYAGSKEAVMTEMTPPKPTTAYAHEKLKQEDLMGAYAHAHAGMTALIARISTIYGAGQAIGKPQGLLTHIARHLLRNQPIQIYVPFDTIRDYIAVDDAARTIIRTMTVARLQSGIHTKIIASESPTTIAEIISIFKRIARRPPLIITSASKLSSVYARRIQFRSVMLTDGTQTARTSLSIGIARLMMAERTAFVRHGLSST